MTLDETVDRFINKAQSKIGRLGNELAFKKMNDDDCYQEQLFLIEELSAAIGLMQCCCEEGTEDDKLCDILTDNDKYQIMSYLIDKAELDSLPLFPYGSICVSNKIALGGNIYNAPTAHNSLTGLQGVGTDYYHLTIDEYQGLIKNKSAATVPPQATDNLLQGWKATAMWLTVSNSMFICTASNNSTATWILIFGSGD